MDNVINSMYNEYDHIISIIEHSNKTTTGVYYRSGYSRDASWLYDRIW